MARDTATDQAKATDTVSDAATALDKIDAGPLELVRVARADPDLRAPNDELPREHQPEPSRAAGDEHDAVM